MNPLTNMKNVKKLSEQELYTSNKTSWHDQYRSSAWIFIGGLPYDLTEGDLVCIFSQYGEIVNINLIRDKDSGKSKGFSFICYEDQRSTDLAVDNFNGIKILNRIIRVDHVNDYKIPKQGKKTDAETKKLYEEGCAPKSVPVAPLIKAPIIKKDPDDFRETLADQINSEIKLPARLPIYTVKKEKIDDEESSEVVVKKEKKEKKHKKEKKKKKKKRKSDDGSDSDGDKSKKKKRKNRNDSDSNYSAEDSVSEDDEKSEKRKTSRSPHERKKR